MGEIEWKQQQQQQEGAGLTHEGIGLRPRLHHDEQLGRRFPTRQESRPRPARSQPASTHSTFAAAQLKNAGRLRFGRHQFQSAGRSEGPPSR